MALGCVYEAMRDETTIMDLAEVVGSPEHLWHTSEQGICKTASNLFSKERLVLDAGSGLGFATKFLRGLGFRVIPIDKSEGTDRMTASVEHLPFGDDAFGSVWCAHVIEHLRSPVDALLELSRVSTMGSMACILVPNVLAIERGHVWIFSTQSLVRLVDLCGFDVREGILMSEGYSTGLIARNAKKGYGQSSIPDSWWCEGTLTVPESLWRSVHSD